MIEFLIQLLVPLALMFYRFQRRNKFILRATVFGVLLLAISLLWYIPVFDIKNEALSYFVFYLAAYLLCFLYVWLLFDMPLINMVFFAVGAFLAQNLSHHIFELGMRVVGVPAGNEYDEIWMLLTLGAIYAAVYSVFYFGVIDRLKPEGFMRIPKTSLAIALAFFLVMIILGVSIRHLNGDIIAVFTIAIVYEVYSVILDIFILCMQFSVFTNGRLRESNEELEKRIEHESRYYEIVHANVDEINIKCHDLKHQISALKHMNDNVERKSAISELEDSVMIYDSIAKTGNEAFDCLLTEKCIYCKRNGINFAVIADGKCLSHMRYTDIYVLFGNAIDNAIEGVLRIADTSKRIITLKVNEKHGQIFIHLENYCEEKLKIVNGFPLSKKEGKGHGFGVRSMTYIVKKYNGNMSVCCEGNLFCVDILIPLA